MPSRDDVVKAAADTLRQERLRNALNALIALGDCLPCGSDDQHDAIDTAIEELKEKFDADYVGQCEECSCVLIEGDEGHRCVDGEPLFCAKHAYTWAEVKESYEEPDGVRDNEPEDYKDFVARYETHIAAGGKPDDKLTWPL